MYKKSKRIPCIFNDESTESFICLRRHIYMSHVNKVQPIRVKNDMHNSNTCDIYKGFCIGCKNTAESFLFLFTVFLPLPHNPRSMHLIVQRLLSLSRFPPTSFCNKRHHTYGYVTCSKVNAKSSRTSSDVTI
jgi:hypothetical protein